MRIIKRIMQISGAFALWTLLCTTCLWACVMQDLKNQPKYEYRYTDLNGNKGVSKACFERDGVNVCVIGKHTRRVVKIEKYKIRKENV